MAEISRHCCDWHAWLVSSFCCLSYVQSTANKSQLALVGGSLGLAPILQGLEEKGRQFTGWAMGDEREWFALHHLLNVLWTAWASISCIYSKNLLPLFLPLGIFPSTHWGCFLFLPTLAFYCVPGLTQITNEPVTAWQLPKTFLQPCPPCPTTLKMAENLLHLTIFCILSPSNVVCK